MNSGRDPRSGPGQSKIMPGPGPLPSNDVWFDWLLRHRHGNDPEYEAKARPILDGYVDWVLDKSRLSYGMTFVDVGTGDGALAFRAIERIGRSLKVFATDLSLPLLQYAEKVARNRGVLEQCRFIHCPAHDLSGIPDHSVDVVATRAVLAYVEDKPAALKEFHRILKPGGRISLGEPILQDEAYIAMALRQKIEREGSATDLLTRALHQWRSAQFPDSEEGMAENPLTNFNERDLFRFVHGAGFTNIHLELNMALIPTLTTSWPVFLGITPHPLAPSLGQVLEERFGPEERRCLENALRPVVEKGQAVAVGRVAYVTASK